MNNARKITVNASKSYDVLVGNNLIKDIGEIFARKFSKCKVAIITDDIVDALYSKTVENSLTENGFSVCKLVFKNGEKSKNFTTYGQIVNFLAKQELSRIDLVVALGGGVVGDVAGFSASTFLRGVKYVQIPTTLLSQIDSSVGGKTAIDLEVGKNLVGAFCQPELVVCDTALLKSLDKKVLEDGFGEGAKYALLDKKVFNLIKKENFSMQDFVYFCIDYKRQIVENDEFENGNRKLLNLGHTVAHAIEKLSSYTISHGNAVAIGLDFVLNSAVEMGRITEKEYHEIKAVLRNITKSVDKSLCPFTKQQLFDCAKFDKKRSGEDISVVNFYGVNNCKIEKIKINNLLGQFI